MKYNNNTKKEDDNKKYFKAANKSNPKIFSFFFSLVSSSCLLSRVCRSMHICMYAYNGETANKFYYTYFNIYLHAFLTH